MAAIVLGSMVAKADGFVCESESGLVLKIYNKTNAEEGTRSAATLVISDSTVSYGNKTIAKFPADKGVLASKELVYSANVDLRMVDSNRKGELIAGTKLGYVDMIHVAIDFSYSKPVAAGTELEGELIVVKRDGEELSESLTCTRYLKN